MHIEPGIVTGANIILSYGTAAVSVGLAARMLVQTFKAERRPLSLALRSLATTALVFSFFELLPHHAVGVSEVLAYGLATPGGPAAPGQLDAAYSLVPSILFSAANAANLARVEFATVELL